MEMFGNLKQVKLGWGRQWGTVSQRLKVGRIPLCCLQRRGAPSPQVQDTRLRYKTLVPFSSLPPITVPPTRAIGSLLKGPVRFRVVPPGRVRLTRVGIWVFVPAVESHQAVSLRGLTQLPGSAGPTRVRSSWVGWIVPQAGSSHAKPGHSEVIT